MATLSNTLRAEKKRNGTKGANYGALAQIAALWHKERCLSTDIFTVLYRNVHMPAKKSHAVKTEPLPAKAGRFGELLKLPKRSASQLLPFILLFPDFKVVRVTSLL